LSARRAPSGTAVALAGLNRMANSFEAHRHLRVCLRLARELEGCRHVGAALAGRAGVALLNDETQHVGHLLVGDLVGGQATSWGHAFTTWMVKMLRASRCERRSSAARWSQ
jgi:hypothetical protein